MSIALVALLAGALSWTLVEYLMHRFRGHDAQSSAAFARHHLQHHSDPRYFAPLRYKLASAARATLLLIGPALLAWGAWAGGAFVLGFLACYGWYEWLHAHLHSHAPANAYGRWARRHHFTHHFRATKRNHGVTSPLWDLVFRTHAAPGQVRIPRRHAPDWLCDPATGEVYSEWAGDYALSGRSRRTRASQPVAPTALAAQAAG